MRCVLLAAALLLPSCAMVVGDTMDVVVFHSRPPGALVTVDNEPIGRTPCAGPVSRSWHWGIVKMELDGHEPFKQQVPRLFNEWFLGNIIAGGIIVGMTVDLISGDVRCAPKVLGVDLKTGKIYETPQQRRDREKWSRTWQRME